MELKRDNIPVLLIVVDLKTQSTFYICLNDYIKYVLPYQNPNYHKQQTVTIYIPIENKLDPADTDSIKWYGKRAKLYGLFQEFHAWVDNFRFVGTHEQIEYTRAFIERIIVSDAWSARSQFSILDHVYSIICEMTQNDMVSEIGKLSIKSLFNANDNPHEIKVFYGIDELPVTAWQAAQLNSCNHLCNLASSVSSEYESEMRQLELPTQYYWIVTH